MYNPSWFCNPVYTEIKQLFDLQLLAFISAKRYLHYVFGGIAASSHTIIINKTQEIVCAIYAYIAISLIPADDLENTNKK